MYGAIMHGEFSGAFLYPDYMEGGSNVVIEVIHRMLTSYIRGDPSTGRPPKKLPPSLYLQLDNTVKCVQLNKQIQLFILLNEKKNTDFQGVQKQVHFLLLEEFG
jgi:hypothetical protein